jgi:hypothetical protein
LDDVAVEMVISDTDTPLREVVKSVRDFGLQGLHYRDKSGRDWWQRVRELISGPFDLDKMRTAAITPAEEGQSSDEAEKFRVFEGQHRTLALAWLLLAGCLAFRSFEMLLVNPGREIC